MTRFASIDRALRRLAFRADVTDGTTRLGELREEELAGIAIFVELGGQLISCSICDGRPGRRG
jgi:hypothetical protein